MFTVSLSAQHLRLVSDLPHSDVFFVVDFVSSSRPSPAAPWKGHYWHRCWAGINERLLMWWTMISADWLTAIVMQFVWVWWLLGSWGQSIPRSLFQIYLKDTVRLQLPPFCFYLRFSQCPNIFWIVILANAIASKQQIVITASHCTVGQDSCGVKKTVNTNWPKEEYNGIQNVCCSKVS